VPAVTVAAVVAAALFLVEAAAVEGIAVADLEVAAVALAIVVATVAANLVVATVAAALDVAADDGAATVILVVGTVEAALLVAAVVAAAAIVPFVAALVVAVVPVALVVAVAVFLVIAATVVGATVVRLVVMAIVVAGTVVTKQVPLLTVNPVLHVSHTSLLVKHSAQFVSVHVAQSEGTDPPLLGSPCPTGQVSQPFIPELPHELQPGRHFIQVPFGPSRKPWEQDIGSHMPAPAIWQKSQFGVHGAHWAVVVPGTGPIEEDAHMSHVVIVVQDAHVWPLESEQLSQPRPSARIPKAPRSIHASHVCLFEQESQLGNVWHCPLHRITRLLKKTNNTERTGSL